MSHTWQADAMGLLDAIVTHGEEMVATGNTSPVYYLDLASVDQHLIDQVHFYYFFFWFFHAFFLFLVLLNPMIFRIV